jgi:chromosome segregation ATPase
MDTRRTLRQQRDDFQRLYADACAERDEARRTADTERFNVKRLAGQVVEARDERAALQQKLDADRPTPTAELRDARRALMLSERARASLDAQIASLQAANEAMCKELADGRPTWGSAS